MDLILNISFWCVVLFLAIGLGFAVNVELIMSKPKNYKK